MKSRLNILILAVAAAAAGMFGVSAGGAMGGQDPASRMWPLDVRINLSSSFAEFRSGHLHAGLDIRTFGREGIPCRAVDDGYVSRLRASQFGYGKAVYLKLATGETVVYAHLAEYTARIDSVVFEAQLKSNGYRVDVHLDPVDLPVKRGQIIGYTGRTGSTAPHLHFEVRNVREQPINPLDAGWELKDEIPPLLRRIKWYPVSKDSRVNGWCAADVVELSQVDSKTSVTEDTMKVAGRVGLAVDVIDRLTTASGKLAPYRVELSIDGRLVTSLELKRFSYDHTREVELAYDMGTARTLGRHYLFLFKREGETLWNREFVEDGIIDADSLAATGRIHHAIVRAYDKWGHVSTATLPFVVVSGTGVGGDSSNPGIKQVRHDDPGTGELPGCYFFGAVASIERLSAVGGAADGAPSGKVIGWGDIPDAGTTFRIADPGYPIDIHIFPVRAGEALVRDFPEIGVGMSTKGGSFYSDTHVYLARWEGDVGRTSFPREAISPSSRAVRLGPMSLALKGSVEVRFPLERDVADNEAVFHFDERKKRWSFQSSFVRGDTVSSFVRQPGVYAVFVDSVAPEISAPRIEFQKSYDTGYSLPAIVVPIAEEGSGLDVEKTEIYIDANKQIARWDGFLQKMFILIRNQNIIGKRDISVMAVDRVGNVSRTNARIDIPAGVPTPGGRTE